MLSREFYQSSLLTLSEEVNKCGSPNVQLSIESSNKVESSVIPLKMKFHFSATAQQSFKAYGFFFFKWKPNKHKLTCSRVAVVLAVNVVKAMKVPIISAVLVMLVSVASVCAGFCCEASGVIISAVRRRVYSGRLYEVC